MNQSEFTPRESIERALGSWWIIVLLMVAGALLGWVFSLFHTPIYEASASLNGSLDITKWLTAIPESQAQITSEEAQIDAAFNSAEMIISSAEVENAVLSDLNAAGVRMSLSDLQKSMSLERKKSLWELRVRSKDPQLAAQIANLWQQKGLAQVQAALEHALKVKSLEDRLTSLTADNAGGNNDAAIQSVSTELAAEKAASHGLLWVMSFSAGDNATAPTEPVVFNTAPLVLAGAFIGLLVSLWLTNIYKGRKRG